jgi:hypothetical protein
MAWAAESIARGGTIRVPCVAARTSPVNSRDVAEVIAAIQENSTGRVGKIYELTGPRLQDMHSLASEFSAALERPVRYVEVHFEQQQDEVRGRKLPEHVFDHIVTMARLHAANRYDRLTQDVEKKTRRPAASVHDFVAALCGRVRPSSPESVRACKSGISYRYLRNVARAESGSLSPLQTETDYASDDSGTTDSSGPAAAGRHFFPVGGG